MALSEQMKFRRKNLDPDPVKVRVALAKNVFRYRNEAGMIRLDLSKLAHVTEITICDIEYAQSDIKLTTLARIRRVLNVPWAKLLKDVS
jgi:DNA-binding XRE family transcriptional regulator